MKRGPKENGSNNRTFQRAKFDQYLTNLIFILDQLLIIQVLLSSSLLLDILNMRKKHFETDKLTELKHT